MEWNIQSKNCMYRGPIGSSGSFCLHPTGIHYCHKNNCPIIPIGVDVSLFDELYHINNRDDLGRVQRVEEIIKLFHKYGIDVSESRFKRAGLFVEARRRVNGLTVTNAPNNQLKLFEEGG